MSRFEWNNAQVARGTWGLGIPYLPPGSTKSAFAIRQPHKVVESLWPQPNPLFQRQNSVDAALAQPANRVMLASMVIPRGVWKLVKEILRHLLRRPVVGVAAAARTRDGRWVLIRRTDTGEWALPGGTVEWGETLRTSIKRELAEEAGIVDVELGQLLGAYSAPERDARFHAVTIVVAATVGAPEQAPDNPLEIEEVSLFGDHELPDRLSHGMTEMLAVARRGTPHWE